MLRDQPIIKQIVRFSNRVNNCPNFPYLKASSTAFGPQDPSAINKALPDGTEQLLLTPPTIAEAQVIALNPDVPKSNSPNDPNSF